MRRFRKWKLRYIKGGALKQDSAQYVREEKEKGYNILWTENLKRRCNG